MLTGYSIRNFKNLVAIPPEEKKLVPFGRINVLIGPNGCGKSSLLQSIDFLRAFFMSSVEVYLKDRGWDYSDLPNLRRTAKSISWDVSAELGPDATGNCAGSYLYTVTLQPRRHLGIGREELFFEPRGKDSERIRLIHREGRRLIIHDRESGKEEHYRALGLPASIMSQFDGPSDRKKFPEMLHFRGWIERFRSYLIWDPKVLRNPDRGKHTEFGPSGEHLATLIGRLKDERPDVFRRLVARLRRLFPTLSDISVSGRGWGWREIHLHEGRGGDGATFNSRQMSDGVLRLIAVTSLLYLDGIPPLITFEEPENGVHPQLVREAIQILRELTQRKPPNECQVFFTTHSPYVLDEFFDHPEQVYCLDRPQPLAGASLFRLSDKKEVAIARDTFEQSLGEAWTSGLIGATAGMKHP